ncbi:hypothetical protein GCM10010497_18300 [Streptomyces cinereoruber]|uniref:Uncharacterized protein n=1 Tax=Streptomyces cinereoruber TaxID=67260 RepID=A0AAV4KGN0_9ACTN|nr:MULTISPECIES: hypothetical protein [Streptomyces]AVH94635.1 hypothetical protein C5L38_05880 [Streptomyces sp. WAC00288]KYG53360.1 hypothetical protein AWI43_01815 [Streptomyces sp. WAC04657]MBB4157715.1 hypothetical protein [Streptomyces cinereoruber]MBY8816366.1 hypothetical protein [Streptomyces cinereoruber]NIH62132.1 hypothetical protein [Streptomyces cinereoruber]
MTIAFTPSDTPPAEAGPAVPESVVPGPAEEAHGPAEEPAGPVMAEEPEFWEPSAPEPRAEEDTEDREEDPEEDRDPEEVDPVVVRDARDFGVYARTGGWAFALKVARSVRPGGQAAEGDARRKVSAKAFAELAGCSPERVMRHYKAWDMAADDGLVPQFEALVPGEDVELPDADVWISYYSSRNSAVSVRGQAISAAAEAEGIRPTKALEVAENPTALRAAILADPGTAEAARGALLDRMKEDPALQTEMARAFVRTDDLKKAVASESKAADRIGYVRQIVEKGQIKTPAGQTVEAPPEVRAEAERHLSLLDELDDSEEAGEWAGEAYDAVKGLVAKAVEEDPALRVQERRTKFYSSLQKATKVFEELTLDEVLEEEVFEDDMLQRLEALQEAIGSCISALRRASTAS